VWEEEEKGKHKAYDKCTSTQTSPVWSPGKHTECICACCHVPGLG